MNSRKSVFTLCTIFVLLLFMSSFVFAEQSSLENTSIAGSELAGEVTFEDSYSLDETLLGYQENNAENEVQLGEQDIETDAKKKMILKDVSFMWMLIGSELLLVIDIMKMGFYLLEMYVFILFLFRIIPSFLIKMKEGIVRWYEE